MAENLGTPVHEPATRKIRGDDHHVRITGQQPVTPRATSKQNHPIHADAELESALQRLEPPDDLGSRLVTHRRNPLQKDPHRILGLDADDVGHRLALDGNEAEDLAR